MSWGKCESGALQCGCEGTLFVEGTLFGIEWFEGNPIMKPTNFAGLPLVDMYPCMCRPGIGPGCIGHSPRGDDVLPSERSRARCCFHACVRLDINHEGGAKLTLCVLFFIASSSGRRHFRPPFSPFGIVPSEVSLWKCPFVIVV